MEQKLLQEENEILDKNGIPLQYGYNTKCVCDFNRDVIGFCKGRLKEWDFYQISNAEWMMQLTIGHAAIGGTANFTILNLLNGYRKEYTIPILCPIGKLNMPGNADKYTVIDHRQKNGNMMRFEVGEKHRKLIARNKSGLKLNLHLTDNCEGVLVCTPFSKIQHFYYNYKKNCMEVTGTVEFDGKKVTFSPKDSFALIDWGRGILPYSHKWWWGNGSHRMEDGKLFGFNIGVFGDTSNATENMLFYDKKAYKLDEVFVDKKDWMSKWQFGSSDGRFEMEFTPVYDNHTHLNFVIVNNECHQVWGKFNGKAVIGDDTVLEIKDMTAFTEFAINHW